MTGAALTPTQFVEGILGRHAEVEGGVGCDASCWLCGGSCRAGALRRDKVFPATFTQHNEATLPDSAFVCAACAFCTRAEVFQRVVRTRGLDVKLWSQCGWHSYSHLVAGPDIYECPKPDRVRALLLDPPDPPFVLGINVSGQKHTLFRTAIALSQDLFPVHFDERVVHVDRPVLAACLAAIETLSVLGFSKAETETGRYRADRIAAAGVSRWREADDVVRPFRIQAPDLMALAAWCGRGPKWFSEQQDARQEVA